MKRLNGLDYYIIYCIVACVLFCIAEMIVSSITGITHDSLTVAWYGFHGGEVFCAAVIKRMKLKQEDKECDWREHGDTIADTGVDSGDL